MILRRREEAESRVYEDGGAVVARACTDIKHLLGTIPVKCQKEGRKRAPYALLIGSPRLLLCAANRGNAFTGNYGSGRSIR